MPRRTSKILLPATAAALNIRSLVPAVLTLLFLGTLTALSGCKGEPPEPLPTQTLSGTFYQLQGGSFYPVPEGQTLSIPPTRPWTVQERVADLVSLEDRVYAGINGYGIAEITFAEEGTSTFNYFYDPLIFRFRTLTTLIPEKDSLLCHLYFNKLLNVVSQTELKLQGLSLLRLSFSSGVYKILTPPYQEAHPDWEAVGFVPVSADRFYFQWKYSDRNRTLFYYSLYDLEEGKEQEVGEQSYRKSYGFQSASKGSHPAVRVLLAEVRSRLDSVGLSTAYQIHLRSEDKPLIQRFEFHPADFTSAEEIRLFSLYGAARGERVLLLLPDGLLLESVSGSRKVGQFRLPALPEGCVYRDLLLHRGYLVAGWERLEFTEVGEAGFFLSKYPEN